jgi:peptidoglycan/LPS O-acetylase OafA/YrhL
VLPGLIFVPPLFLEKLLGSQQGLLEGVFWTIFVEVAFYLIFGFLYYRLKERAIYALALISVLGIIIKVAATQGLLSNLAQLSAAIGLQFFSWFTTGALVYQYRKEATRNNLVLLCISIFITCLSMVSRSSQIGMAVSFLVILLFLAPPYLSWLERALTLRPLLLLGFISYPLYLLHENLLISMILKLVAFAPFVPLVLSPVLPILALVLLAYLVAKYIEPGLRARLAAYL